MARTKLGAKKRGPAGLFNAAISGSTASSLYAMSWARPEISSFIARSKSMDRMKGWNKNNPFLTKSGQITAFHQIEYTMKNIIIGTLALLLAASVSANVASWKNHAAPVPVIQKIRKARAGDGYVIQLWNASTKTLPISVTVERPTSGGAKQYEFVLPPVVPSDFAHEIGWMQGWAASPGDKIIVSSEGFAKASYTVTE